MSFLPTEEQKLLRREARRLLEAKRPFTPRAQSAASLWQDFEQLGWLGAVAPESAGGFGGPVEASILCEELGRALAPEAFDALSAIAFGLLRAGADQGAHDLLQAMLSGASRPALAFSASPAQPGSAPIEPVPGAADATEFLLLAEASSGAVLYRLPRAQATFEQRATFDGRTIGALSATADLRDFTSLPQGAEIVQAAREAYLVYASAAAVGAMARALELACAYVNLREQFGVKLASFQALRHAVADAFIEIELSRSLLAHGVASLSEPNSSARSAALSAMKARIGEAALTVGAAAVQLHGGVGVTAEFEVAHHYRRLLAYELTGGSRAHHVERYAELSQ